jgi:hypothetical protein
VTWVGWVAVALQISGFTLAAYGLIQTQRRFGQGRPFLGPMRAPVRSGVTRFVAAIDRGWRRLLRVPRPIRAVVGSAHVSMDGGSVTVRGRVWYGVPKRDATAGVRALELRTDVLLKELTRLEDRLLAEQEAMQQRIDEADRQRDEAVRRLAEADQELAVGDIHLEAAGLLMAALGTLLQAIWG